MTSWPIFICYRQTDGKSAASRVFELLNEKTLPLPAGAEAGDDLPRLDVYFDQAAPGVGDWTAIHDPYLKRARAFIVICTPGTKLNEGAEDWVHREIGWWLANREMAPILVDPLGEDLRYVPNSIAANWPNAQRIKLIERDWEGLSGDERRSLDDRVRAQFFGAIIPGGESFYRQELKQEKARTAKLQRTRRTAMAAVIALLAVLGVAGWTVYLKDIADRAALEAQAATRLAEARITQSQAARAAIETRVLSILQRFDEFRAHEEVMEQWEQDLQKRATELRQRASVELPSCEEIGGGTAYEGQMVDIDLPGLPDQEALFIYLSIFPGSGTESDQRAPALLDAFFGNRDEFEAGRDLSRTKVVEMMAPVAPENKWGLLMGLGAPHVLTHSGRTYQLTTSSLRMDDHGDIIMGIRVCLEAATVTNSAAGE